MVKGGWEVISKCSTGQEKTSKIVSTQEKTVTTKTLDFWAVAWESRARIRGVMVLRRTLTHKCVPVPPEGPRRMAFVASSHTGLEAESCPRVTPKGQKLWCGKDTPFLGTRPPGPTVQGTALRWEMDPLLFRRSDNLYPTESGRKLFCPSPHFQTLGSLSPSGMQAEALGK